MPDSSTAVSDAQAGGMSTSTSYDPYGQLVKMLLPSSGSLAIYDARGELLWCSDGYERPDLRSVVEALLAAPSNAAADRGTMTQTAAGVPAFLAALKTSDGDALGFLVLELGQGQNSRHNGSMVPSLLRPVLDCLENRMNLEQTIIGADRSTDSQELDLLLSVDEDDRTDAAPLERLVRHCVQHLGCVLGTLLLPDKNVALACAVEDGTITDTAAALLDKTQRHLLAWAQLNDRPMVVNRIGTSEETPKYKILSCPVRDAHNRVMGLIALFRDGNAENFELHDIRILEFVSRKAVSILSSRHDPLTGLINRLIFERQMQSSLDEPVVPGGRSLLYLDVDRLQVVNDAFGFQAGDEILQRLAEVIRGIAGPEDLASRIGGDRFALYLPDSPGDRAREIGESILASFAQLAYLHGDRSIAVSASIGLAVADEQDTVGPHLLAAAELACKRAKQLGRNRLQTASEDNLLVVTRRKQLVASANLQDALKNHGFRLEAQPIVGLAERRDETVGFEALVRMRSSSGESLAPDKFLDAAERYDLMPALDRWVLCSAVDVLKSHRDAICRSPYSFTVNVSAQSMVGGDFTRFALEQIAAAELPPEAFCFEVKEAAAVNHLREAEKFIRELSAAGCKIGLDDFGCGLSSLTHLKQLPVDHLKIDGSFVRRVLTDRVADSIVSGIARAATTLGVSVIAEHIESEALAYKLRQSGVDFGQGFYFGRPQPFAEVVGAALSGPMTLETVTAS
jgi:diguanylate cyclase (GGDEF)-like protein